MKRLMICTALAGLLSACASTSTTNANAGQTAASGNKPATGTTGSVAQASLPPYRDPANALSRKRSVYFGLDQYDVNGEYRPVVEAHAKYLSSHPAQKVVVEGHADEQGSREYNLALGNKRAYAVKRMMTLLGVRDSQVETVSWGEERPMALGHDATAWAQNRRSDINYSGK